ncbi:DUF488 family protein [Lactobacillus helveticus]|uniref:DUF488 family protein n=4 Tax=Lactobacillus helveticus TaxID=1587 RepID=A0AAV4E5W3_LACHE|nr:DUF488 family protein [Lactobacillus helveticus]EGF36209.1 hypothetical protein AAULH_00733 [Lactobacillus helveticus MTCC 5463]ABX26389.1 hypothetical protein lhv_0125 [Lactobacillus helveticus DPC 4571]AGQ22736.1 hypothetical protein lhe_0134 [Lactobacillus helveticus CNRZ32]AJY60742.1 uroporphyrin-III C-methyltransferase [Lactobacillus helveticus]AKG66004.1 uroporphyrin-III C-methyltransferase [Lactobacillus helveticus]
MSEIKLVRIYDHEQPVGYRMLVDRMWPRGMSKIKAALDEWDKQIGPTNELRKWFNHEDEKFPEFKAKYIEELDKNEFTSEFIETVKKQLIKNDVLFLYGAKNRKHNQAVVLKEYVQEKLK